jgi:polyhydroxybutyrate depolymerase
VTEGASLFGLVARVGAVALAIALSQAGCTRATLDAVTGAAADAATDGLPSAGCTSPGVPAGDTTRTVQVGTVSRSYVLHLPAAYDGKKVAPLVLDFHGVGGTGTAELAGSPYPSLLDPAGVVMAFPDGAKGPAGTAWNVGPCCVANVDDVAFARAVVADVGQVACIDTNHVYAVGVLTGGGMAYYLACQAADIFAAAAPAAFDMLADNVGACVPARAISVISFRGTADPRVPYAGGYSSLVPGMPITFLGATGSFQAWAQIDHCAGAASSPDANGCAHYSGCQDGVEVILCTKQGGTDDPGNPAIAWPVLTRHAL